MPINHVAQDMGTAECRAPRVRVRSAGRVCGRDAASRRRGGGVADGPGDRRRPGCRRRCRGGCACGAPQPRLAAVHAGSWGCWRRSTARVRVHDPDRRRRHGGAAGARGTCCAAVGCASLQQGSRCRLVVADCRRAQAISRPQSTGARRASSRKFATKVVGRRGRCARCADWRAPMQASVAGAGASRRRPHWRPTRPWRAWGCSWCRRSAWALGRRGAARAAGCAQLISDRCCGNTAPVSRVAQIHY